MRLKPRPKGMGLMGAIFLVLVASLLTVAVLRTVRTSSDSFAFELLGQRAFWAAESGAQLAALKLYPSVGPLVCDASTVWTLDDLDLPNCVATVSCSAATVGSQSIYTLESHGRCSDGGQYIAERIVQVRSRL